MNELRIVSFLPSATELACALGLADHLVGISHECDYPPEVVLSKPVVVHSALPIATMNLAEIDAAVSARLRSGESLYEVDEQLLRELAPTHILTQDLCQVCAPAGNEVSRALKALPSKPEILWMSPHSIADIDSDLRNLARVTGRTNEAEQLIAANRARLDAVTQIVGRTTAKPRVFCAEWIDPVYCCGHWVPEMVEIAGGIDVLGRKWSDSVRVQWPDVLDADPDIVIVMPCGFDLTGSIEQAKQILANPVLASLAAVQNRNIYAVDAACFSRPGPRVIDGVELLAHILHPDVWPSAVSERDGRQQHDEPLRRRVMARCKHVSLPVATGIPDQRTKETFRRLSARIVSNAGVSQKQCPQCGTPFSCGLDQRKDRCWCAELPPLPTTAITDGGCLCPGCLRQILFKTMASHS